MSKLETFYDRNLGWFNSSRLDLSDLGSPYLEAALADRKRREDIKAKARAKLADG
jgi:hypothetical protein